MILGSAECGGLGTRPNILRIPGLLVQKNLFPSITSERHFYVHAGKNSQAGFRSERGLFVKKVD